MAPPLRNRLPVSTLGATLAEIVCSGRCHSHSSLCRLLHSAIHEGTGHTGCDPDGGPREWALLDTRCRAPSEFIVRNWVGQDGRSIRLPEPLTRHGGILGLFTACASSVSVGRVAGGVDSGLGLLLCGIASVLTIPLPPHAALTLDANWLCVMSRSPSGFSNDAEIDRLMLMTWVILQGPLAPDDPREQPLIAGSHLHARMFGSSEPAAIPTAG